MNVRTQSFVLVAFGIVLVRLATTEALLRYVRPGARPIVLCAGVVVAGLACWRIIADRPRGNSPPGRGARSGWLVLAPVLTLAVVAPPPLGALTANHRGAVPPRPHGPLADLPRSNPVPIALADVVVRAISDHGRSLRGHRLRTVGFVSRRGATGFVLTRLVITCCAADAEPNSVEVTTSAAIPAVDAWVEVTGRFTGMSRTNRFTPAFAADKVDPISPPANPYG
jgi:uncharacterized repeat protein (TIGR03943 family)